MKIIRFLVSGSIALSALACSSSDDTDEPSNHPPAGAGGSTSDDAGTTPVPDFDFAAFDEAVSNYVSENDIAGASAAIIHREYGLLHTSGYGAYDADRIYLIASSSKMLSVVVLMRLHDQGLLDIDAPIADYVGWGDYQPGVTVAQLVSNSSGLPGLVEAPIEYACQYADNDTLEGCGETMFTADASATSVAPDTEFRYGGAQWQIAGAVAEVVSGKSWAELITETYADTCGVETIGYANHFAKAVQLGGNGVASGLTYPPFFNGDPNNLDPTENPLIEGGAYTNAEDYARTLLMHLREGECEIERTLSAESVARMQQDRIAEQYDGVTNEGPLQGYGLGWWIDRDNPGVFVDGGAFGAQPWLDVPRGYGAFIVIEEGTTLGPGMREATKPVLDEIFDAAAR